MGIVTLGDLYNMMSGGQEGGAPEAAPNIVNARDLPGGHQGGVAMVVSMKDAPELAAEQDPTAVPRGTAVPVLKKLTPLAALARAVAPEPAPVPTPPPAKPVHARPITFPALAAKPPQTAPVAPLDPNSKTAQLMASLGLLKPKG